MTEGMGEVTIETGGGAQAPQFLKFFNEMARFGCKKFLKLRKSPPSFFKSPSSF